MNTVNLADVFIALGDRFADRPAIVASTRKLTYASLLQRAACSARELRERDIRACTNVGLALRDNSESVVLMIALWMLGATPVPLDFRSKPIERNQLAREFDLAAIIEDRPAGGSYSSIVVDDGWTDTIGRHDPRPIFAGGAVGPAFISLTSGTAGTPQGIVFDHDRQLLRLLFMRSLSVVDEPGVLINANLLSYSGPRNHTLNHLLNGGTVCFLPPLFSAAEFGEAIRSNSATSVFAVPTIVRGLLDAYGRGPVPAFPGLRLLFCGGGLLFPEEKRRAKSVLSPHFADCYSSGLSGWISYLHGTDVDTHADTVGRVLRHVVLQIVDPGDRPLPPGEAGVIRVRTPTMARGIYGDASRATGDRIHDGWVYPGDIGALGKDGFLRIVGRTTDVIIRGGVNVHPSEIEKAISTFPGVREVAVVGFAASREGEEIAAVLVTETQVAEAELSAHCRARLTPDRLPRRFVFVRELPRNANGKIMRSELRKLLDNGG